MGIQRGIHITSIKQPESGSVCAMHCEQCGQTVIMWNKWMNRPERGDLWGMEGICEHPLHGVMRLKFPKAPFIGGNAIRSSIIYGRAV
jgi:hypothetical protein